MPFCRFCHALAHISYIVANVVQPIVLFLFYVQKANTSYLPDSSPSEIFKTRNRMVGY